MTEYLLNQFDPLIAGLQLTVAPFVDDPIGHLVPTRFEFACEVCVVPATAFHRLLQHQSVKSAHLAIFLRNEPKTPIPVIDVWVIRDF
ncbi:hypothetical protein A2318_03655 [Candidatus Uhrbacteria bacterium RIFOXYB2_FULL_45_11]|uniref:Uncharacterized protein n=1 Tax=Candidatus Uhrbacteria bacterium RIFOXYB2_FULL_45_11 TaxID=1802421 RepID=A0A1F7W534_9BACT|nr:MAG: hypothetical protein A2318_03655 [Candidatus Uhrbacteria bacterium RIFOXYB2_FULL_45_11]